MLIDPIPSFSHPDMAMVEAVVRRSQQFSSIFHSESSGGDGGYGY